jgi:hypothetical protein
MLFGRIDFGIYAEMDDRFRRAKGPPVPEVRCDAHTFGTSSVYPAAHRRQRRGIGLSLRLSLFESIRRLCRGELKVFFDASRGERMSWPLHAQNSFQCHVNCYIATTVELMAKVRYSVRGQHLPARLIFGKIGHHVTVNPSYRFMVT